MPSLLTNYNKMASNETVILKPQTLGWEIEHRMSYHPTVSSIFPPSVYLRGTSEDVNYSRLVTHTVDLGVYIRNRRKKNFKLGMHCKNFFSVTIQCVVGRESRDKRPRVR